MEDSPRKNPNAVITATMGPSAPGGTARAATRVPIMPTAAAAQARCLSTRFMTPSHRGMPRAIASVMGMAMWGIFSASSRYWLA